MRKATLMASANGKASPANESRGNSSGGNIGLYAQHMSSMAAAILTIQSGKNNIFRNFLIVCWLQKGGVSPPHLGYCNLIFLAYQVSCLPRLTLLSCWHYSRNLPLMSWWCVPSSWVYVVCAYVY